MLSSPTLQVPLLLYPARPPRPRSSAGCLAYGPVAAARGSHNVSVVSSRHVCCAVESAAPAADWGDWIEVLDEADEALADVEEQPSIPLGEAERVYLVGAELKDKSKAKANTLPLEESLDELAQLSETAGLKVVGRAVQRLGSLDRRTYIGSGKVAEVLEHARALSVNTVIFDDELSPSQARNIERLAGDTDIRVTDRTALILDVFSTRAATAEGRLQTQLAQVLYQLPRLTRMWTHLERQSGGKTKGAGELQLEIDKRLLREQAARLRAKIEDVRRHREVYRQRRAEASVPILTLVGYTSAGKSALLNKLTDAAVLSDAMLFATLDPTTRRCEMPSGHACLITDTVGFVQKLPTQLVAAFRATLEEVQEASVLIHVVDASHEDFRPYMDAVDAVLKQLDVAHIPMVVLWNKIDIAADPERLRQEAKLQKVRTVCASALTGEGLDDLWLAVQELTEQQLVQLQVLLPFAQMDLLSDIRRHGSVESEEYTEEGVLVKAKVPLFVSQRLGASGTRVA